jgi:hypothetical protein
MDYVHMLVDIQNNNMDDLDQQLKHKQHVAITKEE